MSSGRPKRVFLLAICLQVTAFPLFAQSFGEIGERAQGMGGAFVAVADDASAIYWNPAGLSHIYQFDAQLSATINRFQESENSCRTPVFLGAALPALGLAYYRTNTAVSEAGSRKNEGSGEVRVSTTATGNFGVSLLQTIVSTLVIGTTLRAASGNDRTAFDLDVGAMASAGDVRVGLSARNLRKGLDAIRQVRIGVAYAPRSLPTGIYGPFSVAFDADVTRAPTLAGDDRRAALGSEQWWLEGLLATRAGVQWSMLNDAKPAVSGGLTVKVTHLLYVEGHLTKSKEARESTWGADARITF